MLRTYSIILSLNKVERSRHVVAVGLSWAEAQSTRDRLQRQADEKHQTRSSWTKDLYLIELEKPGVPA
jgi:hypothetical protein